MKRNFQIINWSKLAPGLIFVLVSSIIIICTWLALNNINNRVYGEKESVTNKVLIDVSVSDTLTRGMDQKLNCILQDLLQLKQDSVIIEVKKVQNSHQK